MTESGVFSSWAEADRNAARAVVACSSWRLQLEDLLLLAEDGRPHVGLAVAAVGRGDDGSAGAGAPVLGRARACSAR